MDSIQFERLMRELVANRWKMFLANVFITVGGAIIMSAAFYWTTRGDLQAVLHALEMTRHQQTSSGNSVHISSPRTVEDNAHAILKKQGLVE